MNPRNPGPLWAPTWSAETLLQSPERTATSPMVSPIKSLNICRSISKTASYIAIGQSTHRLMVSPITKSFSNISFKVFDRSLPWILWNSDEICCSEAELVHELGFQGGNCLFRSRISLIVSKNSLLWSLATLDVSLPFRYCCFSSKRNISESYTNNKDKNKNKIMFSFNTNLARFLLLLKLYSQ